MTTPARPVDVLRMRFGDIAQENVLLAPYTSARIGGKADVLVTVTSAEQLAAVTQTIWQQGAFYTLLGGGSNVLVSDKGARGIVILNRAKAIRFEEGDSPSVWCESGAVFSNVANRCAARGFAGLEWAATVPGTVGGALYGNAGAFGGDMMQCLVSLEALTRARRKTISVEEMQYAYRSSVLKKHNQEAIILSARLRLKNADKESVSAKIQSFAQKRKATQPPGASMGSMFKNPPGDYAGRLLEAAGLKGARIGSAEISAVHANFFVNHGETTASDIRALIELARKTVLEKFGIALELEVELIGDW